jgi:hypothetical protein
MTIAEAAMSLSIAELTIAARRVVGVTGQCCLAGWTTEVPQLFLKSEV